MLLLVISSIMPIDKKSLSFLISGNAPDHYPSELFFGIIRLSTDDEQGIPKLYPFSGEWGQPLTTTLLNREKFPIPSYLDMVYLSIVERRFYSIENRLPKEKIELCLSMNDPGGGPLFEYIVVGMAPYGGVAVWLSGENKEILLDWMKGEEVQVSMADFMPMTPTVTLEENCSFYIMNDLAVKENLEQNGLPPKNFFDKYMQQFSYRYQVLFGRWNEDDEKWEEFKESDDIPQLEFLKEMLFDGTHDKLNDGGLMKYHEAGKPKKIAIKWHIKKWEFSAYFWFVDEAIKDVFDRFYGPHPDTKTDFMIQIDSKNNKYQLAMYRYGLKEPYVLPKESYELIVFRNKFEAYRSENYSQKTGAWIW